MRFMAGCSDINVGCQLVKARELRLNPRRDSCPALLHTMIQCLPDIFRETVQFSNAQDNVSSPGLGFRRNSNRSPNTRAPLATLYEIGLVVASWVIEMLGRSVG